MVASELQVLLQHTRLCRAWLELGASSKLEVKANCFHALARVLGEPTRLTRPSERIPEPTAAVWTLNERLFNSLGQLCRGQATVLFLMEVLRQPFEEIRSAVFVLLRAAASQNSAWGVRVLLSYGGLVEFLMDRSTEPTKETREWKFAVADAVVASPFRSLLGACDSRSGVGTLLLARSVWLGLERSIAHLCSSRCRRFVCGVSGCCFRLSLVCADAVTIEKLEAHLRRGPYVGTAPASMDLEAA